MTANARLVWLAAMLAVDIGCASRAPLTQAPAPVPAPAPPAPVAIAPLPALPAEQIERREVPPAPRQLYSLEVTDTEIRDVLLALGKSTDLSFVIAPGVEGTITVNLKQVTLEEMLDAILTPIDLTYQRDGGVIRVSKPQLQTRVFTVNYITTQRAGNSGLSASAGQGGGSSGQSAGAAGAAGGGASGGGSTSTVGGTDTFDLWGELEESLMMMLSADGRLISSQTAGLVAVTDYPANVMQVARYLDLVQGSVHRQVMIEAQILEITLNDSSRAGIDWSQIPQRLSLPGFGATTGSLSGGAILSQTAGGAASSVFQFGLATQTGLRLLLSALEEQGRVSILSSPKVSTLNNQKAIMKVATDDVFFTRTTQREPLTGVVTETVTPNTVTEGLVLDVTPQIGEDAITMNIRPSISERLGERTSSTGDTVPILAVRASDTVVRVRDGETVVIGGLMHTRSSRSTSGVPGLQRAPIVGRAFRSETEEQNKIELVILLTPTVQVGRGDTELTPRELQLLREAGAGRARR